MPRRSISDPHRWSLKGDQSGDIANARIALALMRSVRRLPGLVPEHNYDDVGEALAPAFESLKGRLRAAMKAHFQSASAREVDDCDIDLASAAILHDRSVQTLLGKALARPLAGFKTLFDDVETTLANFVTTHAHPADQNVETLARLIGLGAPESAFLKLAAAFCYGNINRSNFSFVDTRPKLVKALSAVCEAEGTQVAQMLQLRGSLARSGMLAALSNDRTGSDLDDLLGLSAIGERLLSVPFANAADMSAAVLTPFRARPDAPRLDWPHLEKPQTLLRAALVAALERKAPGINVLLHGVPGTGKTEFARALLADIGATAFAVDHGDKHGEEASRNDRLASLQLSQTFAGEHQGAVLVLDEAEDIFQSDYQHPFARLFSKSSESKAWMNHLLETNPHPVIWISNQVRHLDPAYLRRFALCLEFPKTPYAMRRRIAGQELAAVGCSPETVDAIAASESMTPALIDSAVRFASLSKSSGLGPDVAVRTVVDEHVKASGHSAPPLSPKRATRFDLRYLQVEGNVTPERVMSALRTDTATNLVFCGPPGTGKTQFAAEIASQLGRHLVVRTASDINTMWYGESERNVASMFRECDPKSELLFLDEAEILLGSREASSHRADRAVTAEFLRWMEVFEGIFVCATNRVADFDAALMRRFMFRLEFKPLDHRQRQELYAELVSGWVPAEAEHFPELDTETATRLRALELLTPGDFANVAKRMRHLGLPTSSWMEELEAEHAAKGQGTWTRVGFV
jgi:SpoVK/Ycf46/Vps4 family AAA+-type ATPase